MMVLHSFVLLLCVSAAVVSQGSAQTTNCPLITVSDLGSTTNHSNVGVVSNALRASGDGRDSPQPSLLIHDHEITCSVAGSAPDTYQHLSVVVLVNCADTGVQGTLPCTSSRLLGGEGNFTVQIELTCGVAGWQRGASPSLGIGSNSEENSLTVPANGTLDTALDSQCGLCASNTLRESAITAAVVYNNESHCVCKLHGH